jgi:methyltransferase (TIGR00027 family)
MASSESPISNVSDTALWVAYYRAKESKRADALFRDPLAAVLIGERGKKIANYMQGVSKYTEWTVLMRTVTIDRMIEAAVKNGVDTILNLGAGMDTRPYRMKLAPGLKWVEADYPAVIEHKRVALEKEVPVCRLERIPCDLSNDAERSQLLARVAGMSHNVLVLTEGVVLYLSEEQVSALSADLLKYSQFRFWLVEYLHARVYPYLQRGARAEKLRNAPIIFMPADWIKFFSDRGWRVKEIQYHGEEGARQNRWMPMPLFGRILARLVPAKVLERTGRMTGFMLLER